jgi:hypothetical protein
MAYCLAPNHVHLILVDDRAETLRLAHVELLKKGASVALWVRTGTNREGALWVALTRSLFRRGMSAVCVKRTLRETPRYSSRFVSKPVQLIELQSESERISRKIHMY